MATIDVKDAAGATVALEKPNGNGRQAAAGSRPVALSNEDLAALELLATILGAADANPAANTIGARLKGILSVLGGVLTVEAASLPLPAGAATAANQATLIGHVDGLEGALGSILTTLQAQVSVGSTLWTDDSGAFYVRRDINDGGVFSVAFTTPAGDPATPGAGLRPAANEESLTTAERVYDATANGAGYSTGDVLLRSVTVNQNAAPPVVVASFWLNLTTGAVIAAPGAGHYQPSNSVVVGSSVLPTGAATEGTLAAVLAALAPLGTAANQAVANTLTGAVTETAPGSDTASSGLNGRLQRIAQRISALIALLPVSLGAKAAAASMAVTQSTEDAARVATIGTRAYGTIERVASGAASTQSSPIAATEVLLHASKRCYVLSGANPTASATTAIPLEAGEKFHMRITSGHKIAVIRDTEDGFLHIAAVA